MNALLDALVAKLPRKVQPYAKAFLPLAAVVNVAAADLAISGPELRQIIAAACAGLYSAIVWAIPNAREETP